jgi:hypothetical protein
MEDLLTAFIHKFKTHLGRRFLLLNIALFVLIKIITPLGSMDIAEIRSQISASIDSREIITETNAVRLANGLGPLSPNLLLDNAANAKLSDMIKNDYFDHISPAGIAPWFWIANEGYKYSVAGENLAVGFYSAKDTVNAWMDSVSHKANLLHPKYTEIGVASTQASVGGVRGILVVQMFGVPSGVTVAVMAPTPKPITKITPSPVITSAPSITIAPSVTATSTIAPSATPPNAVAAVETTSAIAGTTGNNEWKEVSTDISVPAVHQPVVKASPSSSLRSILNYSYLIYLSLILIISAALYILHKESRQTVMFGMGAHAMLLILALSIPALQATTSRIVF